MNRRQIPYNIKVGNENYRLCVFLVNTKFPDGTPRLCTRIKDDATIELAGGEEFVTAYLPKKMVEGFEDEIS